MARIALVDAGGNATYHSLQASLQEHVSNGLTLFLNYTWSKAIDNFPFGASATAVVPGSGYSLPVYEPDFKRLDYGPSDYDYRNRVVAQTYKDFLDVALANEAVKLVLTWDMSDRRTSLNDGPTHHRKQPNCLPEAREQTHCRSDL